MVVGMPTKKKKKLIIAYEHESCDGYGNVELIIRASCINFDKVCR
jgi:hypothetical protein